MKSSLAYLLLLFSNYSFGDTLIMQGYTIEIEVNCPEGKILCDDVTFIRRAKNSQSTTQLRGKSLHGNCANGKVPCDFLGYRFRNGDMEYTVYEKGLLQVWEDGMTLLVSKQGVWVGESK